MPPSGGGCPVAPEDVSVPPLGTYPYAALAWPVVLLVGCVIPLWVGKEDLDDAAIALCDVLAPWLGGGG